MEDIAMDVREAIAARRSVRQFDLLPIPPEHMEILFKALQSGASANNSQNWEFVFAGDPVLKQRLVPACYHQKFVGGCGYFIAAIAEPSLTWHMVDITIALTNFTLQAVELGYGTCWIGAFSETLVKSILNVPRDKKVVICMAFGRPRVQPPPRWRKPVEEFISLNQYGTPWTSHS
jgi:nitroreductase